MIKTHNEREKKLVRILRINIESALKDDGKYFEVIYKGSIQGMFDAMYYMDMIKDPVSFNSIEGLKRIKEIYNL